MKAYYVNRRHTFVIIAVIWLFAAVVQSPVLLIDQLVITHMQAGGYTTRDVVVCRTPRHTHTGWVSVYQLLIALQVPIIYTNCLFTTPLTLLQRLPIPVTIAALLYTRTCMKLWRVDKVAHATARLDRSAVQKRLAKELGKRKRAVKMMIVSVTLFFLCYAPRNVTDFIRLVF